MEEKTVSPAFRNLAKWCAVLGMIVVMYPLVFLIPGSGNPYDAMSDAAIMTTHTHLGGHTILFFVIGFLFTFTSWRKAKKIWPTIGAISIILMAFGLFFGLLPLIITGNSLFVITIIVMAVGVLGWL